MWGKKTKKKSFLWFIYDAMKGCWTHQNMPQWSHCQGRWSVFIVDWANKRGERKREREKIRRRDRRVAVLQKGVNHLISTAPPPHSPQNGYFCRPAPPGRLHFNRRYLISHLCSRFFHLKCSSCLYTTLCLAEKSAPPFHLSSYGINCSRWTIVTHIFRSAF